MNLNVVRSLCEFCTLTEYLLTSLIKIFDIAKRFTKCYLQIQRKDKESCENYVYLSSMLTF